MIIIGVYLNLKHEKENTSMKKNFLELVTCITSLNKKKLELVTCVTSLNKKKLELVTCVISLNKNFLALVKCPQNGKWKNILNAPFFETLFFFLLFD